MGKHHGPVDPVIIRRGFGSASGQKYMGFDIRRHRSDGTLDPWGSEIIIHDCNYDDDHGELPAHRIEDKSIRVVEVDVSDREDVQRLWRLERSRFGHKFFSIDANGKYNHNWCFEDSMEYYEEHGDFPDIIITMRHKDFMEEHEG